MANTSATGGYLLPLNLPEPEDQELNVILQNCIRDLSGLPGDLVRPRWQPDPPPMPKKTLTWAAIGTTTQVPDSYGYTREAEDGQSATVTVHWTIEALLSVYGPNASRIASRVAMGFLLAQNREALASLGIKYFGRNPPLEVPELINAQWVRRTDLGLQFRRAIQMDYAVLTLLSAQGQIDNETYSQPFTVEE